MADLNHELIYLLTNSLNAALLRRFKMKCVKKKKSELKPIKSGSQLKFSVLTDNESVSMRTVLFEIFEVILHLGAAFITTCIPYLLNLLTNKLNTDCAKKH